MFPIWPVLASHTHKPCAAKGQTCRKCNGRDHFARVANRGRSTPRTRPKRPLPPKSTRVYVVEDSFSSGDESDYVYVVSVQDPSDQDSDTSFEPELALPELINSDSEPSLI